MTRIPYPYRSVPLIIAAIALVTLAVPTLLVAQMAQSSTADATLGSKIQSPASEPQRVQVELASDKGGIDTATDVEIQRRFDELKSELLDDRREFLDKRAKDVDWWLTAIVVFLTLISVFLTFFAIAVAIVSIFGFQRFRQIEDEARQSVAAAKEYAKTAKEHAEATEEYKERARHDSKQIETIHGTVLSSAKSSPEDVTAEATHSDPDKASEAMETVQQNSLIDQAIADATSLQQQGKVKEAIEKWRSIANIVGVGDSQLQARAWFSVGYLHGEEANREAAIDAYTRAIRLKPDMASAYNNRGNAKADLGQHEAALADYDEALRLKPDMASAYNNRGVTKKNLGRPNEAREDYQKALALAQESGDEDLIAKVQSNLSQLDKGEAP